MQIKATAKKMVNKLEELRKATDVRLRGFGEIHAGRLLKTTTRLKDVAADLELLTTDALTLKSLENGGPKGINVGNDELGGGAGSACEQLSSPGLRRRIPAAHEPAPMRHPATFPPTQIGIISISIPVHFQNLLGKEKAPDWFSEKYREEGYGGFLPGYFGEIDGRNDSALTSAEYLENNRIIGEVLCGLAVDNIGGEDGRENSGRSGELEEDGKQEIVHPDLRMLRMNNILFTRCEMRESGKNGKMELVHYRLFVLVMEPVKKSAVACLYVCYVKFWKRAEADRGEDLRACI
ncbi:hypothetical protein BDZ91DRAFT_827213 [Kalaharituber pfeilii]|nr:hypothetical protein BDZ91DRAFT_827213 [Kalaharituber pfeilii]